MNTINTSLQHNWSGNISFNATAYHRPENVAQVQEIVHRADIVSIVGARHSFTNIADTQGHQICLDRLDVPVTIDRQRHTATVGAGIRYMELGRLLHAAGYALPNLASLPDITIAGACATATHGSGKGLGNLATVVSGLEFVAANGDLVTLTRKRDGDRFNGAVVNMGGLGVITRMTLDLVPTFTMQQEIYHDLPLAELYANFDGIMNAAYSVCLFTNWQNGQIDSTWVKHKLVDNSLIDVPSDFFGATLAPREPNDPNPDSDRYLTRRGIVAPSHELLPHIYLKDRSSRGREYQTEYFVSRHNVVAALQAVEALRELLAPIILLTEIRTVAADSLWMSTAYDRDTVGIHFGWYKKLPEIQRVLPILEESLAPFAARPHWGKLFAMPFERISQLYDRLPDFQELLRSYDPHGKFCNAFLARYIMGKSGP